MCQKMANMTDFSENGVQNVSKKGIIEGFLLKWGQKVVQNGGFGGRKWQKMAFALNLSQKGGPEGGSRRGGVGYPLGFSILNEDLQY